MEKTQTPVKKLNAGKQKRLLTLKTVFDFFPFEQLWGGAFCCRTLQNC
jgi:hypothetical protein